MEFPPMEFRARSYPFGQVPRMKSDLSNCLSNHSAELPSAVRLFKVVKNLNPLGPTGDTAVLLAPSTPRGALPSCTSGTCSHPDNQTR